MKTIHQCNGKKQALAMRVELDQHHAMASPAPSMELASLHCPHQDVELLHRITQSLLFALSTSCVEKTFGDLFKSPISVVGDVKKELIDFLHQHSASYPSQRDDTPLPAPSELADDLLDEFVRSKTSLLSRMSSVMGTERKEERIDDLAQDLDRTGAWVMADREALAKSLLKQLDRSRSSNCDKEFQTKEELDAHMGTCPLRPIKCPNDGCGRVLSALHAGEHDAVCSFKFIPCEQKCQARVMRSEMDKHCITVCPMKLVKCPFFQVGCNNSLPQMMVEQHCVDSMGFHLISVLQSLHKQEVAVSSSTRRILLLEKALSISQRSEAVDVGTLTLTIHQQDAKIKALEQETTRLRQDLKAISMSSDVLQLHRDLEDLRKKVEK